MRRQATYWEEIFAKHIADQRFQSRVYKEVFKITRKQAIQYKHGRTIYMSTSPKRRYGWQISG